MSKTVFHLGLDIGGTNSLVGIFSRSLELLVWRKIPTNSVLGEASIESRLSDVINDLLSEIGGDSPDLACAGVCGPGPLDSESGVFRNPFTLPGLDGWNVVTFLERSYGCRAHLENDADMAAYGEFLSASEPRPDPMLMLTVGTGIGGALVSSGKIYRGAGGEHPEYGLIPVLDHGPSCYSGVVGSLESWTSGSAIKQFSLHHRLDGPGDLFTSTTPAVAETRKNMATAWRRGILTWLHCFYPSEIVLGGGVLEYQSEWYLKQTMEALGESRMIEQSSVKVRLARLKSLAGIHGAAGFAKYLCQ